MRTKVLANTKSYYEMRLWERLIDSIIAHLVNGIFDRSKSLRPWQMDWSMKHESYF